MSTPWRLPTFEAGIRMGATCCCQVSHNKSIIYSEVQILHSVFGTLLDVTIKEDESVSQVCSQMFHSQVTTLDKCLQQYTEQELVSSKGSYIAILKFQLTIVKQR